MQSAWVSRPLLVRDLLEGAAICSHLFAQPCLSPTRRLLHGPMCIKSSAWHILVACVRAEVTFFKPDGTLSRSASLQGQGDSVHLRVIRSELTHQVIKEAQRMHPDAVKIHFDTLVEHVDLKGQMLHASSVRSTNIVKV